MGGERKVLGEELRRWKSQNRQVEKVKADVQNVRAFAFVLRSACYDFVRSNENTASPAYEIIKEASQQFAYEVYLLFGGSSSPLKFNTKQVRKKLLRPLYDELWKTMLDAGGGMLNVFDTMKSQYQNKHRPEAMVLLFLDMVYTLVCDHPRVGENGLLNMALDVSHRMNQFDRMIILQFLCNRRKHRIMPLGAPKSCYVCMAVHQQMAQTADLDACVRTLVGKSKSIFYSLAAKVPTEIKVACQELF